MRPFHARARGVVRLGYFVEVDDLELRADQGEDPAMTTEEEIEALQRNVISLYQETDMLINYIDALQRGSPALGNLKSSHKIRDELARWHKALLDKRKESLGNA